MKLLLLDYVYKRVIVFHSWPMLQNPYGLTNNDLVKFVVMLILNVNKR